jgi:uncharacterized membrane protein
MGNAMEEQTRMGRTRAFGSVWWRRLLRRSHVQSHPRLLGAVAVAIIVYFLLSDATETATRFLIAFGGGALVFLAAIWVMMARATPDGMRRRAEIEDEGRYTVLILSAAAATAILLTIVFELHGIKDLPPGLAGFRVALAAATILLSWFFMNTMFALHYAHGYYGDSDPSSEYKPTGGLIFPGRAQPDYWDFIYFSFVVGMTFQVSDVQIEDHDLRRNVLAHGVLAFFFNVVILALTINIVAGLI